jgi:hypothetical protein
MLLQSLSVLRQMGWLYSMAPENGVTKQIKESCASFALKVPCCAQYTNLAAKILPFACCACH